MEFTSDFGRIKVLRVYNSYGSMNQTFFKELFVCNLRYNPI